MDEKNREKGMERGGGLLEVHRATPYEFCLTSEPVVLSGLDVATTAVYGSSSDREPQPFFVQSLTFER